MKKILMICLCSYLLLSSCVEDELAFDVIESPVLATFDQMSTSSDANLMVEATFYELDKSGILDNTIGIDSIELAGMEITVFINEDTEITTLTTDGQGTAVFDYSKEDLMGASRLEWVGTHNGTPFRIYYNF